MKFLIVTFPIACLRILFFGYPSDTETFLLIGITMALTFNYIIRNRKVFKA